MRFELVFGDIKELAYPFKKVVEEEISLTDESRTTSPTPTIVLSTMTPSQTV